jgi:Carboxypeptidase regulatory-like domain
MFDQRAISSGAKQFLLRLVLGVLFSLTGLAMCTFGQQATIVGTVTDPSGAVIPNVEVTIANRDTQVSHTLRTNDAGQYVAPDLPISNYDLQAAASGFRVEETKGVVLNVNDRIRVNFRKPIFSPECSEAVPSKSRELDSRHDGSSRLWSPNRALRGL